jgi:hypothetical protein
MRLNILIKMSLLAAVAMTAACGGAQFKPTAGEKPQKALKPGSKVEFVETADALPQPVIVVGVLAETTKKGEDDRKAVEKDFKMLAMGKGCDAVVGLKLDTDEQHAQQKVYHKDADGKVVMAVEDVATILYRWSAQCVRTAAAADGSATAPKRSVVAPGPGPEPAVVPGDRMGPMDAGDPAVNDVVAKLLPFESTYLRHWKDKLHAVPVEPLDAVGATLELMAQVDKFWKITVPMEWLGCKSDPRNEACVAHSKLLKDLRRVDDLRHDMERLDRSPAALSWLRKNSNRVAVYLDTFVPTETSDSAMRATPFWLEHQGH